MLLWHPVAADHRHCPATGHLSRGTYTNICVSPTSSDLLSLEEFPKTTFPPLGLHPTCGRHPHTSTAPRRPAWSLSPTCLFIHLRPFCQCRCQVSAAAGMALSWVSRVGVGGGTSSLGARAGLNPRSSHGDSPASPTRLNGCPEAVTYPLSFFCF